MSDKISELILSLGGDDSDLRNILSSFKARLRNDVTELQAIADKLDLFGRLTDSLPKAKAALDDAREQVKKFRDEVAAIREAGAAPTKALVDDLAKAEAAARSAGSEFKKQTTTLDGTRAALVAAKVDVANFGAAQLKMAAEVSAATEKLALQNAKDLLGFKSIGDVQPQIVKLQTAFDTLKASGTLSSTQLATAQALLQKKIGEVNAEVSTFGKSFSGAFESAQASVFRFLPGAAALGITLGTVAHVLIECFEAAAKFNSQVALLGTVSNLSAAQLHAIGESAKALSVELGIDAADAIKGVYELLRSGVPKENVLDALRISAEAAKGSLITTAEGVKTATVLISAMGIPVSQLRGAFDVLSQAQRDSGATLAEFGNVAGPLAAVARATGFAFNDVVAALTIMTDATGDAATSAGDLQRIMVKLADPDTRAKLRAMNIEATTLVGIFTALGASDKTVSQVIDLGIASTKSVTGVSALTVNAAKLNGEFDRLNEASGTVAENLRIVLDTPQSRSQRFHSAWESIKDDLGNVIGPSSRVAGAFADLYTTLRDNDGITARVVSGQQSIISALWDMSIAQRDRAIPATNEAGVASKAYAEAVAEVGRQLQDVNTKIAKTAEDLGKIGETLSGDVKALQDAANAELDLITKQGAERIAALERVAKDAAALLASQLADSADRTTAALEAQAGVLFRAQGAAEALAAEIVDVGNAQGTAIENVTERYGKSIVDLWAEVGSIVELTNASIVDDASKSVVGATDIIKASAAAIVQTQLDFAAKRLAVITKSEADITKVTDDAIAAREISLRKTLTSEAEIQAQLATIRKASIAPTLAAYQKLYDDLTAQESAYAAKVVSLQQGRLAFAESIEKAIFDIRIAGLSSFDAYVEKSKEADRLVSLSRQAATIGDAANAEKYGNQAIGIANSLGVSYSANGSIIISAGEAQAAKLRVINGVADSVNTAYANAGKAAKEGADKTKQIQDEVKEKLDGLLATQKSMAELAAKGLNYKIDIDRNSYDAARQLLDDLTKDRVIKIRTQVDQQNLVGDTTGGAGGVGTFRRGGYVPQRFAAGGPVGVDGAWKVPGTGSGDIVPATLRAGSFVLRKAAAQFFGDSALSQVARLAEGGPARTPFTTGGDVVELHALKVAAAEMFATLRAGTQLLPRSEWGQNVGDYLGKLLDLIEQTNDLKRAHALFDPIAETFDALLAGIDNAKRWHVPFVMGVSVTDSASGASAKPGSGGSVNSGTPLFSRGNPFGTWAGFAEGGPVRALLEPGEWVLNPRAAARIGSDVLHAANALRLTPGVLARFAPPMAPIPRFNSGGPVPGLAIPTRGDAGGNGGGIRDVHVHNYGGDLSNPAVVRRVLLPVIREIERRAS